MMISGSSTQRAAVVGRVSRDLAALVALAIAVYLLGLLLYAPPRRAHLAHDLTAFVHADQGFHAVEQFDQRDGAFRWTTGAARMDLPNPGGLLQVRLLLAAGPERTVPVQLATANTALTFQVDAAPRIYALLLKPEPGEQFALHIDSPNFVEAGSSCSLGVALGDVTIQGRRAPPRGVALALLLAMVPAYALVRRLGARPAAAAFGVLGWQALLLGWHATGGWRLAVFWSLLAASVIVGGAAVLGRWLAQNAAGQAPAAPPLRPAALALLGAATLAYAGVYLGAAIWTQTQINVGLAYDFNIYLEAGRQALSGMNPYQPFLIGVSFVYPPPTLSLFAPLATLSQATVDLIWLTLACTAYLLALLSLWFGVRTAAAPAWPGGAARVALVACLLTCTFAYAPLWETLTIGQVNCLILLGIALFIQGHTDERAVWVGDMALVVAIMLKITPLLLMALPVMRRDWARCLRVAGGLFGLTLLALPWFGLKVWGEFAEILPLLFAGVPDNPFNQSFAATVYALGGPATYETSRWLGRVFTLGLLAIWVGGCLVWRRRNPAQLLALGALIMTIASSLLWYHHLVFLVVPCAWLLLNYPLQSRVGRATLGALLLIQTERLVEFGWAVPPLSSVLGYLILLACMLWTLRPAVAPDQAAVRPVL